MTLNPEQQAIVDSDASHILAICGPGTGKSRCLVSRILKLIERGAKPSEVIAISYTVAASKVLQERLGDIKLGANSTLHAFAFRMLSEQGTFVGLPSKLSICDDDAKEGIVESIMAEMGIKCSVKKVMPLLSEPRYIEIIVGTKSKESLVAIEFNQQLRRSGLLTFDLVLYYFLKLLKHPELKWMFKHILCDELQDSANADMDIYEAMPCETKFMAGDPDQSIFAFRGACPERFLNLAKASERGVDNVQALRPGRK